MRIDTRGWEKFKLEKLFDIGTGAICKTKDLQEGKTPRISVKGINNGIQGYFKDINSRDYRTMENFISFSFLGTCFYHPYKASLDMKVHSLKPKDYKLNMFSGLFLVNVFKKSFMGVYDDQISSSDLKQEAVLLPAINKDKPDWEFMENYIKQSKKEVAHLLTIYRNLKSKSVARSMDSILADSATAGGGGVSFTLSEYEEFYKSSACEIPKNLQWQSFGFNEVFTYKRGKQYKKLDHTSGKIPYISSSAINNGIDNYVNPPGYMHIYTNKITLANSGSVGSCFYHPYSFVASDHCMVVWLKDRELNRYLALFFNAILEKELKPNISLLERLTTRG